MNVLLFLYLCSDATHTDCQVLPAQLWQGPNAYEQCLNAVPELTQALTAHNRELHRFVCEVQPDGAEPAEGLTRPTVEHQEINGSNSRGESVCPSVTVFQQLPPQQAQEGLS